MAAGDEKSAIPFERNASIPVRDGAAKGGRMLATDVNPWQGFAGAAQP
jgi:hypothetical protein